MLKHLLTLCAINVIAANVCASPNVGDKAVYNVLVESPIGATLTFQQTAQVKALTQDEVIVEIVTQMSHQTYKDLISIPTAEFPNRQKIQQFVIQCQELGGTPQTTTLKGQTLPACLVNDGSIETLIADVPFGIVKQVERDSQGNTFVTQLIDYSWQVNP